MTIHSFPLKNPTDRGALRAAVHGIAESDMTERLTQGTQGTENHEDTRERWMGWGVGKF